MNNTPESGPPSRDANDPANRLYTWEHVKAARREGIEAALNACLRREHFHTVDDYDGVIDDLRADGARGCIAAIRALLEDEG